MKKFAALSMAAVMLTGCFVGCGSKSSDSSNLNGKYEAYKMEYDGQTYEGDFMGMPIGTMLQFELKDDGVAVGYEGGKAEDDKVTWKKDGDKLILSPAEEATTDENGEVDKPLEFKVDGDELTIDQEGVKMTVKKVSEFTTAAANSDED